MSIISKMKDKLREAMRDERIADMADDQGPYDFVTHTLPKCEVTRVPKPGGDVNVVFEVPTTFSEDGKASFICDGQRIKPSKTLFGGVPYMDYTQTTDHWQPEQRELIELTVKQNDEFVKKTVSFRELDRQVELAQEQKEAKAEKYTKQALAEMGVEMDETTEEVLFQK